MKGRGREEGRVDRILSSLMRIWEEEKRMETRMRKKRRKRERERLYLQTIPKNSNF